MSRKMIGESWIMTRIKVKHQWKIPLHYIRLTHQLSHYGDVIMSAMASQITSLTFVYSTVYSGADQRKHQSSASLAFVRGIHRWPVNSPHKGPCSNADNVSISWRHMLKWTTTHEASGSSTTSNAGLWIICSAWNTPADCLAAWV